MRSIRRKQPAAEEPKVKVTAKKTAQPVAAKKKTKKPVKHLALKPRASEKAYALSESSNTYVFDVERGVNKFDVAQAVAGQYDVTVTSVRLASNPGKAVKTYRQKGRRSQAGRRSAVRKAYVGLKQGDKLPIFAAVEESAAPKETK